MTPAQWVEERASEWAEWVDKNRSGGAGYDSGGSCAIAEVAGRGDGYGHAIDFVIFDHERCAEFESEVNALPSHLRIVFKMHWLGSEAAMVSCAAAVDVKAGHCGVSRATYYRLLNEANLLLYRGLQ